jgi:hypothetical protein
VHYFRTYETEVDGTELKRIETEKSFCFLMTESQGVKSVISKCDMVENVDYTIKTIEKNVVNTIRFNENTRIKMASLGMMENVHYDVTKDDEGPVVRIRCIRSGVLPIILAVLLSSRKQTRASAKGVTDKNILNAIDGKQLALKMIANSIYGGMGVSKGYLPCKPVAESVTRSGRGYILFTKSIVEEKFTVKNGYPFDAIVVYGDTDSVFVRYTNSVYPLLRPKDSPWIYDDPKWNASRPELSCIYDLLLVCKYGVEMAKYVTDMIGASPMCLAYEKSFKTILFISKKRYAGYKITWIELGDGRFIIDMGNTKFSASGMECVRRDSCVLVAELTKKVLVTLIEKDDPVQAVKMVTDALDVSRSYSVRVNVLTMYQDLLRGKINYSKLIISKSLSRKAEDYKVASHHVALVKKMKKRDSSYDPKIGERIKYVIVSGSKLQSDSERSEDPLYALENGLVLDMNFYINNQLKAPLHRIFYYVNTNTKIKNRIIESNPDAKWSQIYNPTRFDPKVDVSDDESDDTNVVSVNTTRSGVDDNARAITDTDDTKRVLGKRKSDISSLSCNKKTIGQEKTFHHDTDSNRSETGNTSDSISVLGKRKTDIASFFANKNASGHEKTILSKLPTKISKKIENKRKRIVKQEMNVGITNSMLFSGIQSITMVKHQKPITNQSESTGSNVNRDGGLTAFFTEKTKCYHCENVTHDPNAMLCGTCRSDTVIVNASKKKLSDDTSTMEEKVEKIHEICRNCVKDTPDTNFSNCRNDDCSVLWDRLICGRDLLELKKMSIRDW